MGAGETAMSADCRDVDELLKRAVTGDQDCWAVLQIRYEQRLRRMVALRLHLRLQGRVDPSDVVQDAYLSAWLDLDSYVRRPAMPFYFWLRGIAGNRLRELHRHHLGTRMRDARREVSLDHGARPDSTSVVLAEVLKGHLSRPGEALVLAETNDRVREALLSMDQVDREVLDLRHFKQLSPAETAQMLGIKEKAAGMRYVRALRRLREIMIGAGREWLES